MIFLVPGGTCLSWSSLSWRRWAEMRFCARSSRMMASLRCAYASSAAYLAGKKEEKKRKKKNEKRKEEKRERRKEKEKKGDRRQNDSFLSFPRMHAMQSCPPSVAFLTWSCRHPARPRCRTTCDRAGPAPAPTPAQASLRTNKNEMT